MMKRIFPLLAVLSLVLAAGCGTTKGALSGSASATAVAPAADNGAAPKAEKKAEGLTKEQIGRYSYAVGVDVGRNFKREGVDLDLDRLAKGLRDSYGGGGREEFTDNEVLDALRVLKKELNDRQAKKVHDMMKKNRDDGQAYQDANAKKDGVKKTQSGLQYRVVKEGTGKSPKADDTVTVHYKGTFIDGKEFDSSYARNEPATFPVSGVIPGWTEALQLMKEGGKAELCIPAALAYGEQGAGSVIPPNSTLLFEVELLSVKGEEADKAAPAPAAPEAPKAEKK